MDDLRLATPCYVRVLRALAEIRDGIVDLTGNREMQALGEAVDLDFIKQQAEAEGKQALGQGEGPTQVLITIGYAGWSAGQLENEIRQNAWLTVAADASTLFDTPPEGRMSGALGLLGIDLSRLSEQAGHA